VTWPWRSPQATRSALSAKVKARRRPELRQQRMREIAYRRLLARLFATQPEQRVVKGGAALLLRLDPNRTSNDIDLAYLAQAG
jgi:nucleotidyltransferase AbiEii toxin of type IV toxin-antitoxin system